MALLEQQHIVGNGMVKEIEESAMSLVLQNLQQDHYQYPIKSVIREIASNAVDSIEEKLIAIKILNGEAKVEDYYSDIESEITKDSKFDKSYYNLNHLNSENEVNITYLHRDRDITNRDLVIIEDTGVGLGGERLKGFFRPAFSTKRLNKKALGKFGIGSKSPLATGIESYQLVSVYNGREYHFDIYEDRFYSTVPAFNNSGQPNPYEIWKAKRYTDNGTIEEFENKIYYIPTKAKNGVKILIDVKNPIRNQQKYKDAVKSQLTYFDYVRFFEEYEKEEDRWKNTEIHFKTNILYKDENLIIPEDNYYSVPHLVLNGVNYGTIDFAEMEMDEKRGNIGIIGDPNEIDVSQSRESVRYTEKTRNAIKKYLKNSIKVAQDFVDKEMKTSQDDFVSWLLACRDLKAKNSRDNVFSRLSGLADLSAVEFTHKSGIKYTQTNFKEVFKGFKITKTTIHRVNGYFRTRTVDINSWENFNPNYLYFRSNTNDRISNIKLGYIAYKKEWESGYLNFYLPDREIYIITPIKVESLEKDELEILNNIHKVMPLLRKSSLFRDYTNMTVPDDFIEYYKTNQEKQDAEEQKLAEEAALTEKEIRKKNGLVLYHRFIWNCGTYRGYEDSIIEDFRISKKRVDIHIDNIPKVFSPETTIYGTQKDIPLLKTLLHLVEANKEYNNRYIEMWTDEFNIIVVSKEVVKYIDKYATHIKKALQNVENNKIKIMPKLRDYNTAKEFKHIPEDNNYMYLMLFEAVDKDAYDAYLELIRFVKHNGFSKSWKNEVPGADDIEEYMENLKSYQLFLLNEKDPNKIAKKSKELFNTPGITSCDAINMKMYAKFKALEDYIEDMKSIFKPYSISYNASYSNSSIFDYNAMREYINLKGIPNYSEFLAARCEEFNVSLTDSNN